MKFSILTLVGFFTILISGHAFSACASSRTCDSGYCDSYINDCQCTDPVCHTADRGCLSTAECCEAFGNMGAR